MTFSVGVGAVVMNARQMLAGLPVRMAEGGPAEVWTPGDSVGRRRAIESGNEAGWLQAVAASADRWMANPGTAAEAYDAMVQSGIGIKDLLDAGVSQATIDQALSIPTPEAQKQVNRLTATSLTNTLAQNPTVAAELASRGAQDVYQQSRQFVENLQKDGLTDAERRQLQQVASQQGWGYSDIRAAGVDPSILFQSYTAPVGGGGGTGGGGTGGGVIGGGGTGGTGSVFPDSLPYTPVTVYDPEKFAREQGADPLYTKGQPALDTAFRESPVRTVSPTTGQYVYTPAATLRPATGSGWSWAPPVVTSRPRQLLDVAPTASASQLYALSRQEQDRALRKAFASANIPASGQDAYYWQSRLRSGDYSGPSGAFDPAKFGQDFQSWAANRGSGTSGTSGTSSAVSGAISQNQQMYDEFGNPIQSGTDVMQPKMFLGFADGGDVRARELLDRLKKPEGTEERALGAEESSYAPAPGESVMGNLSKQVGRGARALRDIAVNLTPLSQMENEAERISLEHYPNSRQYGGESDALRHLLFQSQAVQRFGEPASKALSLLNEYGLGTLEAQPREHIRMDLENDRLGRKVGLADMSEEEKLQAILDLIESGRAPVVSPQPEEFAKGGEASAAPSPQDLLAQIDASMANSPASAQGTASSEPSQTDSRSMLRRLSDAFGQNVTAPVVGSALDMTVGLGDLAQMGLKAGAEKLGMQTEPFTPVSSAIQESLGVEGYDPYSPAAIATAIGVPAAAALRAAGTVARGSRPLMSAAMPRTPSGRRPAPGSAEELLMRLAPIVDKEASIYASSELAAMGAREVAPDNMTAEIAAAVAGGGAYNTLDNILSSSSRSADMGPANTARSQMAQIYQHLPTPERPFVGRLDSFIANDLNVGRISRDELLARMRGKFRGPELLRVERAFEGVDPKAKLTPNEVLEKLQASYDPSDLELVTIRGDVPYKSMDNPWLGDEQSLGTQREQLTGVGEDMQGTIVLRRAGQPSQSTVDPEMVSAAENTYRELDRTGPLTADDPFVRGLIYTRAYEDFAAPFKDIFLKRGWDYTKQFVLERLDNMESAVNYRSAQATELGVLNDKFETLGAVTADLFPQKRLELLEQGGVSREDLMGKAYAKAFEEAYSEAVTGTALNSPYSTDLILSFPKPENITDPQLANEFLKTRARPYLSEQLREISKDTALRLSGELRMLRDSDDVRDALEKMSAQEQQIVPGVNPDYRGQHRMVTESMPGVVSFSRTTDVRTEIPGMGQVRGIYLHELQSDLLDDLRKRQGGIPRGATEEELQRTISTTQDQVEPISNKIRELNEQLRDMPPADSGIRATERMVLTDEIVSLQNKRDALLGNLAPVYDRLESLREGKRSRFDLDEIFPGMTTDSKSVQTMMIKAAVASAAQRGLNFVALPSQLYSGQPQLYERLPQNARDVVKDLGEGFALQQINLRNRAGEFPVLAITWDQSTAEGREGLNRVLTRGVPFKHGGEVTTQPDDLKNLLSFLDKKPASKRK